MNSSPPWVAPPSVRPWPARRRSGRRPSAATPSSAPACAASACGAVRSRKQYADVAEFVGLCDINPLRVEVAKKQIGVSCPTFTNFDQMMDKAKPDLLMVTTVDGYHSEYIVKALDRGIDVMTEKPMVIDETAVPGGARRRKEERPQHRRHLQLPLLAEAPDRQRAVDEGHHRQGVVGGFLLVPRHAPRRRLFPPLASPALEGRFACGSTRRRTISISSTGGSTPIRCRCRRSAACSSTARAARSATPRAAAARTRRSARTTGTSRRTRT